MQVKSLLKLGKKAVYEPQFISDHNEIKSVVLNYEEYERMYREIDDLREALWEHKFLSEWRSQTRVRQNQSLLRHI